MTSNDVPDISDILRKVSGTDTDKPNINALPKQVKSKPAIAPIKPEHTIPKGKPKSGRIWKTQKERFAVVKKSVRGKAKAKHLAYREEIKHIKELSRSIIQERKQQNEEKRQRREENKQRRLENERKSEIVQIIKNPAKLKRMRKKQLRQIEKRDFDKLKVV